MYLPCAIVLVFQTSKKCEKNTETVYQYNSSNINASFILSVHGVKTGHGILIEDLGFDFLIFAFERFEILIKMGFEV